MTSSSEIEATSALDEDFETMLIAQTPKLRAFARSLVGASDTADDLVQETLIRALAAKDTFQIGTSIRAWLFTIQRNIFYNQIRKRKREVEDIDEEHAAQMSSPPRQLSSLELDDVAARMSQIPPLQREALILVSVEGFSIQEAAAICSCAEGTIKSRVSRARNRLTELVEDSG